MAVSVYTGASSSDIVYVNYTGDTPTKDNITNMTEVVQAYNAGKVIAIKAIVNRESSIAAKVPFFLSKALNQGGAIYVFYFIADYVESISDTEAISCPYCIKIQCSQTQTNDGFVYTVSDVTDYGLTKAIPALHAYTHETGGDDAITPESIGAQPKITANGILKGDGTGTITAADETEVELVDLPIQAEAITIPKGRMRGDVDGDGKITQNDQTLITNATAQLITLTGADLWCADVNADGSVTAADTQVISQYLNGISSFLTSVPTFADYYNNWTYVKVDDLTGYWTAEIPIAGLTTSNNVVVNICETFPLGKFYKAEVSTGKVKIYATTPPITDIPAIVVISSGNGKGSIPSYLNESSVQPEVFWATYGETTAAELNAAWDAGKLIKLKQGQLRYELGLRYGTQSFQFYTVFTNAKSGPIRRATLKLVDGTWEQEVIGYICDMLTSVSLPTASWTGSDPYTQTVTIGSSNANTKVDIQPSETLYDQLVSDNVGYLAIKNVDGTLTAVAKGGKPSVDLTVQVTYNNVS